MMGDKKFAQDYTTVCRTCLHSNVEMLILNTYINNTKGENTKISYMDCLKMCIQVEEHLDVEMPQRICLDCASALQVSYWFMKNACEAQQLLKLKLREIRRKKEIEIENATENVKKAKRYRCKICNIKVETKRSLKDHVKLHLDIIVYCCQLCSYESHNRNSLCDHYVQMHIVEATKEQLKPKTKLSTTSPPCSSAIATHDNMEGAIKNEHFQILPEDTQQISYERFIKPIVINTSCSTGTMQLPTVTTTANPNYTTISTPFNALEGELNNDHNIGNDFMVLSDGSLKKLMDRDIEYINAPNNDRKLALKNGLVLDNIIQMQNIDNNVMLEEQDNIGQMDVDDLIIEDRGDVIEETQEGVLLPLEEERIPATIIEQPKKLMCKICTKDFLTQEQLKNHMLTHSEIPHFFCDQCKFYTFFKIDLHQHYKSKHNLHPTNKQLQPKNKQKTINEFYACDLCFYEAKAKTDLKAHYKTKHNIEANEIHLKPTNVEKYKSSLSPLSAKAKAAAIVSKTTKPSTSKNIQIRSTEQPTPDYPNGLNCRKCNEVFFWRNKLYEHYKMHNTQEAVLKQEKQLIKVQNKPTLSNLCQNKTQSTKTQLVRKAIFTETKLETTNRLNFSSLGTLALNVTSPNITTLNSVAPLTPSSNSTYTLPSDAVPQIVETDQNIENDMDFYFNCEDDAFFQDFDDNVDVGNDSDSNDTEFRNVLLTSDDDFEGMLHDQNDVNNASSAADTTRSFCVHCQKSFISQYQFENHMFIHRGLAPYRCELCTNLYNTKRCLIRHYKAVHKNVPTRDMIQAKGDKVCDDKTPTELLKLEATNRLMCSKCPYENADQNNIKIHLKASHNIYDDSYIMKSLIDDVNDVQRPVVETRRVLMKYVVVQKVIAPPNSMELPFECPRCIRSFENKEKLLRHLERNHSLTPINQQQVRFDSVENKSATSTTATINKTDPSEIDASCAHSDIFTKQKQHQYRNTCPPGSTINQFVLENAADSDNTIIPVEECTSQTTHLVYNGSSTNSSNSITNILSVSNEFIAAPIVRTALDDNGFDQPLFKCKVCFVTCYNLATFNEHSKRIDCRTISVNNSSDYKMLFECEICHCNYKTMYLLKHHLKRHIGRKFLCVECPKTFINKVELEAHKHVHSGERPHKCDLCTKSFRYIHHLKRHKDSVHYGKRHACTEPNCGRKFTTLAQLKMHIWTHNGIVPYKCQFCNRLFKKRLLLREHCLKIHNINLSEDEIAEIFRNSLGYTNPHDFTVTIGNGKMLRRGDFETMAALGVIKSSFK